MDEKAQKLKTKREKAEADLRELKRKERLHARALSDQERKDDTRRKIIDGAHMQTRALHPDIAAMLQADREAKLDDDRDRLLFGLSLLSDSEKAERMAARNVGAPASGTDLRLVVGN